MMPSLPSASKLTELAKFAELVNALANNATLKQLLDDLADQKKQIEADSESVNARIDALKTLEEQSSQKIQEALQTNEQANELLRSAQEASEAADVKGADVTKREDDLADREKTFEAYVQQTKDELNQRSADLDTRDASLANAQAEVDALKADYESKIAELKKIAG